MARARARGWLGLPFCNGHLGKLWVRRANVGPTMTRQHHSLAVTGNGPDGNPPVRAAARGFKLEGGEN